MGVNGPRVSPGGIALFPWALLPHHARGTCPVLVPVNACPARVPGFGER